MSHKNILANSIAMDIIDSKIKIPSLPVSAQQILAIAQQPVDKIEIKILEQLIQKDPILFAQILNLANSSYYGTGREIVGLRNAIMRIGLEETVSSLSLYMFKNSLPVFPQIKGVSDAEYWEESWACAVASRRLGDPRLLVEALPGELYIAGLLQGIGKLILAVYDPKLFYECIKITRSFGKSLEQAELEIFGTTDSLVAYRILESWHLPPNICAAVGYCQSPESAPPEYIEIAALMQFASVIIKIIWDIEKVEQEGERLSIATNLEKLDNTYISRNSSSLLADKLEQYKIVKEIKSIVKIQAAATQSPGIQQSAAEKTARNTLKHLISEPDTNKGFFPRLISFFKK